MICNRNFCTPCRWFLLCIIPNQIVLSIYVTPHRKPYLICVSDILCCQFILAFFSGLIFCCNLNCRSFYLLRSRSNHRLTSVIAQNIYVNIICTSIIFVICNVYSYFICSIRLFLCSVPNNITLIPKTPNRNLYFFDPCRCHYIFDNYIKSSIFSTIILNCNICTWSHHFKCRISNKYLFAIRETCIGMHLIDISYLISWYTYIRFPYST